MLQVFVSAYAQDGSSACKNCTMHASIQQLGVETGCVYDPATDYCYLDYAHRANCEYRRETCHMRFDSGSCNYYLRMAGDGMCPDFSCALKADKVNARASAEWCTSPERDASADLCMQHFVTWWMDSTLMFATCAFESGRCKASEHIGQQFCFDDCDRLMPRIRTGDTAYEYCNTDPRRKHNETECRLHYIDWEVDGVRFAAPCQHSEGECLAGETHFMCGEMHA